MTRKTGRRLYFCPMRKVQFNDLGLKHYKEVWDYQEKLLAENIEIKRADDPAPSPENYLLFTEHFPVYTLGKNGDAGHVLLNREIRERMGIEYFKINRGGDITYHGPGQLVGYPIFDLDQFKPDLTWYLRSLEEVIIKTIADYGLKGERSKGETGVWIDPHKKGFERKICAMGIRCSRWITMHGFALNVNTDLSYFNHIIPCGIQNKKVTSIASETGSAVKMEEVKMKVRKYFEEVFDVEWKAVANEPSSKVAL